MVASLTQAPQTAAADADDAALQRMFATGARARVVWPRPATLCVRLCWEVSSSRRPSGAAASRPCAEYYFSYLYIR